MIDFESIILALFDNAALRQLTSTTFSLKPIHCFGKIKLILDTPGLGKNQADNSNLLRMQVPITLLGTSLTSKQETKKKNL